MDFRRKCSVAFATGLLVLTGCAQQNVERRSGQPTRSGLAVGDRDFPPPRARSTPSTASLSAVLSGIESLVRQMHFPTTTTPRLAAPPRPNFVGPPGVQPRASAVQSSGGVSGSVNGFPCGGMLPPCYVLARESGGNPTVIEGHGSPFSHASGLWQDMPATWNNYKGYPYAAAAPPDIQNEFNRILWNNGLGCSNWSAC